MSAVVYRFYSATPELLYVGTSSNFGQRLTGHNSRAPWFPEARTVTIEHFATSTEAKTAEREAIVAERPLHNINLAPAAAKREKRARREDRSAWLAEGLVMNADFFDDFAALKGMTVAELAEVIGTSEAWLTNLRAGEPTLLPIAQLVAGALGVGIASLFPNHNPKWIVVDGQFVYARTPA